MIDENHEAVDKNDCTIRGLLKLTRHKRGVRTPTIVKGESKGEISFNQKKLSTNGRMSTKMGNHFRVQCS